MSSQVGQRLSDADLVIDNDTGPEVIRVDRVPCKLTASAAGTIKGWNGNAYETTGEAFTAGSHTIVVPGRYQIELGGAGYVTLQEPEGK